MSTTDTTTAATVILAHRHGDSRFGQSIRIDRPTASTARSSYRMLRRAGLGRHVARLAVVQLLSAGQRDRS